MEQYDRITQILQSQSTPKMRELNSIDSASALASSLVGKQSYSDVYSGRQQDAYNNQRQVQSDELSREMNILKVFEAKKAAGDAQAQALDNKIKLFTGDDPEGMAIFLEQLHNDPDEIDAGNSYQVMTKLAGIAKRTGYKSPQMRQKEQMDGVNNEILRKLGGKSSPASVRNNNPGNMRPVGQGEGFQAFNSPQEGLRAMEADLTAKITGQSPIMKERYGEGYQPTLQSIIETWAPPSENDTAGYVNFVAQKTGLQPNSVLSPMDIQKLIPAMIEMEGGKEASQYYQPVQTADSGQIMNDGVDEIIQLQVMAAMAKGDQEGALKIMADAQKDSTKATGDAKQGSFDTEQDLRKEFEGLPDVKQFRDVESAYKRIQKAERQASAAGDIALIFNFMKMLDPGSTVREGEFATAQTAAGVPTQIWNLYNKSLTGERLAPEQRTDFLTQAKSQYLGAEELFNERSTQFEDLAKNYGLDSKRIVTRARSKVTEDKTEDKLPVDVKNLSNDELLKQLGNM